MACVGVTLANRAAAPKWKNLRRPRSKTSSVMTHLQTLGTGRGIDADHSSQRRRPQENYGHQFGVSVPAPFEERLHVLHRDQTNIVSKRGELASDVMRSRTRFHADQAARNVGEPALKLSARAFELPNDCAALIETDKMEAILTEIDANRADGGWCGFV